MLALAMASQFSLLARSIDSDEQTFLGTFAYDETFNTSIIELNTNLIPNHGPHCLNALAENGELALRCFQVMEILSPLHYNLILHVYDNQLQRVTLAYNPDVDGIVPKVNLAARGPNPQAIKLKRVTKTYKDKKAGDKALTAQFEEDVVVENKSWFQRNWKKLIMGAVIYSAISSYGAQPKQAPTKND